MSKTLTDARTSIRTPLPAWLDEERHRHRTQIRIQRFRRSDEIRKPDRRCRRGCRTSSRHPHRLQQGHPAVDLARLRRRHPTRRENGRQRSMKSRPEGSRKTRMLTKSRFSPFFAPFRIDFDAFSDRSGTSKRLAASQPISFESRNLAMRDVRVRGPGVRRFDRVLPGSAPVPTGRFHSTR